MRVLWEGGRGTAPPPPRPPKTNKAVLGDMFEDENELQISDTDSEETMSDVGLEVGVPQMWTELGLVEMEHLSGGSTDRESRMSTGGEASEQKLMQ